MTLLWSTPRVWETRDPITATKLNEISNQMTYLFTPSRVIKTMKTGGTNVTTASTTPIVVDTAIYGINIELTGLRDVRVTLTGLIMNNTLNAANRVDVLIDGVTYLSSLTTTQLNNGIWSVTQYVAGSLIPVSIDVMIPAGALTAGWHTFDIAMWTATGTLTWYEGAASVFSQFMVTE